MNKKGFTFIIVLIILVALVAILFAFFHFSKQKSENMPETCATNNSCVKVQTTCCPCSSGGQEACVPNSKVKEYQKNLENCPKDLICAQVYGCHNLTCSCINSTCSSG